MTLRQDVETFIHEKSMLFEAETFENLVKRDVFLNWTSIVRALHPEDKFTHSLADALRATCTIWGLPIKENNQTSIEYHYLFELDHELVMMHVDQPVIHIHCLDDMKKHLYENGLIKPSAICPVYCELRKARQQDEP